MTKDQHENGSGTPHILIVDRSPSYRGQLGKIFKGAGISYEGAQNTDTALKKLSDGETPITGVVTDALRGDYRQIIEAARGIGANVVLMTGSSLTVSQAKSEGLTAFLQGNLIGDHVEQASIDAMVATLAPPAPAPSEL